ncbi:MAG: ABC transporter ATP-binding protein [Proteobacteria bacterium]|nr:ABC transporter ATP-binding protein [Pseudomonadota bacterium]
MSETVLNINDLNTHYGKIHALRGISLSVEKGKIIALLGANGAGKSTTLKAISSLVDVTSGSIDFMGDDITKLPAHEVVNKGLIHVPEGRHIFKGMTIRENLDLGSFTLKDDAERKRRMQHVFEMFPILDDRQNGDAALLSGGEQQMLAIGRAMMTEPRLLLLDEPSMGLAPFLVQNIMKIVKRLNNEGTTILLVEQNAKVALKIADYGYVLENGKIVIEGPAEELQQDESIIKAYLGH